jgi:hypothetical protein
MPTTLEIFAGPIVRKVAQDDVYVWVALEAVSTVEVVVFSGDTIIGRGLSQSISLQDKVFIHLTKVLPVRGSFPINQPLGYSIGVPASGSFDHLPFGAVIAKDGLTYGSNHGFAYPTFIIQGGNAKLNIAFGSCRKIHDEGADAFTLVDQFLQQNYNDTSKRPHVLYLGGDQIYADDVEQDYVLPAIIALSKRLSLVEQLPQSATYTTSYLKRGEIVKKAGFTSTAAEGHLLSFGEFVAMYGLTLSANNWQGLIAGNTTAAVEDPIQRSEKQQILGTVKDFIGSLPGVRRVSANTATYMIFDDHDVTDDWFITNKDKRTVLGNANGRRIIANAMAAYFLFQGWGNAPERFNFPEIKEIIEAHINRGGNRKPWQPFDDYFLDLNWEYAAPTIPTCYF